MAILTIYTPTYNREKLLPRVYESLKKQTCKDFIWLIVDDGSTDNTKLLVREWINAEKGFEIRYHYKENGGVHTARDAAYRLCDTELIMSEDSDDWLYDDAVEVLLKCWNNRPSKEYAGIFSHEDDPTGKSICPSFPKNVKEASLQDFVYKHGCRGEKHTVIRSNIIKAIPDAPVFKGEKLVGENYKWMQLPDVPFLLLDCSIGVKDFQDKGLTKSSSDYFFNNPKGYRETRAVFIKHGRYLEARIKGHMGYIASCIYLKEWSRIAKSPRPVGSIFLTPAGIATYCLLLSRRKRANG